MTLSWPECSSVQSNLCIFILCFYFLCNALRHRHKCWIKLALCLSTGRVGVMKDVMKSNQEVPSPGKQLEEYVNLSFWLVNIYVQHQPVTWETANLTYHYCGTFS